MGGILSLNQHLRALGDVAVPSALDPHVSVSRDPLAEVVIAPVAPWDLCTLIYAFPPLKLLHLLRIEKEGILVILLVLNCHRWICCADLVRRLPHTLLLALVAWLLKPRF